MPVPVSGTTSGTGPPLATVRTAWRRTVAAGVNVTAIVQVASRATATPVQLLLAIAKSTASGPPSSGAPGVTGAAATLVIAIATAALEVPTTWPPTSTAVGAASSGPASLPDTVNTDVVARTLSSPSAMLNTRFGVPTISCRVTASPR